eukprot:TRINITY_DN7046_c0_g1_i1.p1 TRINITY_DN7046_c0_g1~~TRINITY_DN7046_c0_g1_i1.p1  ORF type:complete len:684 (-),score=130.18 TRINITY_DN7046_c0_g1_i1:55-2106(-)
MKAASSSAWDRAQEQAGMLCHFVRGFDGDLAAALEGLRRHPALLSPPQPPIIAGPSAALPHPRELRERGNEAFRAGRWADAAVAYTRGAAAAGCTSELPLCFANRAAVLMKLNKNVEAAEDCTRALEHGFPQDTCYKVYHRRGLANMARGQFGSAVDDFAAALGYCTAAPRNADEIKGCLEKARVAATSETAPEDIVATEIKCTKAHVYAGTSSVKGAGRGLFTNVNCSPGDMLFAEDPCAAVLLPEHHFTRCHHCFRQCFALLPCPDCRLTMWCSNECRDSAVAYHSFECRHAGFYREAPTPVVLALRILLCAAGDSTRELNAHVRDMESETLAESLLLSLVTVQSLGDALAAELSCEVEGLAEALASLLCKLKSNTFAIFEVISTDDDAVVQTTRQVKVAQALFPTAVVINHACRPNAVLQYAGRRVIVHSAEALPCGAELFISYGPHEASAPSAERRRALRAQYFFQCVCPACTDTVADSSQGLCFRCPVTQECAGVLLPGGSQCPTCNALIDSTIYGKLNEDARRAARMLCDGASLLDGNVPEKAMPLLAECLKLRLALFPHHHKAIGEAHDALSRAYSELKDWHNAVRHCRESVACLSSIYEPTSVELGYELLKLAQLLFNEHDDAVAALTVVERAQGCFEANYGSAQSLCEPLRELTRMRTALLGIVRESVGAYWNV